MLGLRRFSDAGAAGVKRALAAGSVSPLVVVYGQLPGQSSEDAQLAGLLGALAAVYVPLEIRDLGKEKEAKVTGLGWAGAANIMEQALAIEAGRTVCRDIGGSDPERTAAPRVEQYVRSLFPGGGNVSVEVVQGQATFEKEYPCLAAVNRAASHVARHDGRVIWLTYTPAAGKVEKTLYMVGKGITYDTGGADIKAGKYCLLTSILYYYHCSPRWCDGRHVPGQVWSSSSRRRDGHHQQTAAPGCQGEWCPVMCHV